MISLHNDYVSLRADEHDGMTVVSLKFKGMETVLYDDERRKSGATYGIPILFPTPNRISGGEFTFNGKCIKGEMHGALRHAAFRITSQSETSVEGEVPFSALGETFPYDGRIKLSLHIEGTAVIWDFSVINEGDEPLAFGLALHPFFMKFLREQNLELRQEWIFDSCAYGVPKVLDSSIFAYTGFERIWSLTDRPDALLVFSDDMVSGLAMSFYHLGVRVPEDIRLYIHKTLENELILPFPCTLLENRICELADLLVRQLIDQSEGRAPVPASLACDFREWLP